MIQEVVASLQADPWVWNFIRVNAGVSIHTVKRCNELQISIADYWKAYKARGLSALHRERKLPIFVSGSKI